MSKLPYDGFLADMIDIRRTCLIAPRMMPVVSRGKVFAQNIRMVQTPAFDMSVEDYVLGLFALCLADTPPITICGGWVATQEVFDDIPSRWAERARELHRAFGSDRTREVADYLRQTNIGVDLANIEDHEEIRRFGTPRQAIIGYALILAVREQAPERAELMERARVAEPLATEIEIEIAARSATNLLAEMSAKTDLGVRSGACR